MLKTARDLALPAPTTATQALNLAAGVLFDRDIAAPPGRTPSRLAAAAYRGERDAPPLIGSLTDGLAKQNGTDGERPTVDPVIREVPLLRRPVVVGLMTSGVGAAFATPRTTVKDATLKRRPAPTVASVQGRLGLHVPRPSPAPHRPQRSRRALSSPAVCCRARTSPARPPPTRPLASGIRWARSLAAWAPSPAGPRRCHGGPGEPRRADAVGRGCDPVTWCCCTHRTRARTPTPSADRRWPSRARRAS